MYCAENAPNENPFSAVECSVSQASEIVRSSATVSLDTPAGSTSSDIPARSPRLSAARRSDRALPFSEKSSSGT
jgi:hypothetical protein